MTKINVETKSNDKILLEVEGDYLEIMKMMISVCMQSKRFKDIIFVLYEALNDEKITKEIRKNILSKIKF